MLRDRWAKQAAKQYRALDKSTKQRIDEAVSEMRADPAAPPSKPLRKALKGKWSRRFGHLRMVYSVDSEQNVLFVEVLQVRDKVYRMASRRRRGRPR